MHIIRSAEVSEEFRRQAEHVRFAVDDMVPVEDVKDLWRLPVALRPELLSQQATQFIRLYNTNKDGYGRFVERARNQGFKLVHHLGPDFLWLQGSLGTPRNRKTIYLVVPHPNIKQEADAQAPSPAPRASLNENATNSDGAVTTRKTSEQEPQAANEIDIDISALRQHTVVQLRTWNDGTLTVSPIELHVGDMLQLDDNEWLDVKAGGIALILIRYRFEEIKE